MAKPLLEQWKKNRHFLKKSYAQGGTLVSPKSGELKLGDTLGVTIQGKSTRKRRNPLTLRLSDRNRAILQAKARAAGLSVNRYVLMVSVGADYMMPKDPDLIRLLLKLNRQLTGIGTNINQATAKLHREGNGADYVASLEEVKRPLFDVLQILRAALPPKRPMP